MWAECRLGVATVVRVYVGLVPTGKATRAAACSMPLQRSPSAYRSCIKAKIAPWVGYNTRVLPGACQDITL
jgi:hypothetical protein